MDERTEGSLSQCICLNDPKILGDLQMEIYNLARQISQKWDSTGRCPIAQKLALTLLTMYILQIQFGMPSSETPLAFRDMADEIASVTSNPNIHANPGGLN